MADPVTPPPVTPAPAPPPPAPPAPPPPAASDSAALEGLRKELEQVRAARRTAEERVVALEGDLERQRVQYALGPDVDDEVAEIAVRRHKKATAHLKEPPPFADWWRGVVADEAQVAGVGSVLKPYAERARSALTPPAGTQPPAAQTPGSPGQTPRAVEKAPPVGAARTPAAPSNTGAAKTHAELRAMGPDGARAYLAGQGLTPRIVDARLQAAGLLPRR
jgi:hypothetical protein